MKRRGERLIASSVCCVTYSGPAGPSPTIVIRGRALITT
jgi:hypothetical protein